MCNQSNKSIHLYFISNQEVENTGNTKKTIIFNNDEICNPEKHLTCKTVITKEDVKLNDRHWNGKIFKNKVRIPFCWIKKIH